MHFTFEINRLIKLFRCGDLIYRVAYQLEKDEGSNNDRKATKMPHPLLLQCPYSPPLVKWLLPKSRGHKRATKEVSHSSFLLRENKCSLLICFFCFSSHPQAGVSGRWSETSARLWRFWYPGWSQAHCSARIKCFYGGRLSCWIKNLCFRLFQTKMRDQDK